MANQVRSIARSSPRVLSTISNIQDGGFEYSVTQLPHICNDSSCKGCGIGLDVDSENEGIRFLLKLNRLLGCKHSLCILD